MNKVKKLNYKQEIVKLEKLLKEDFESNFKNFKKLYEENNQSKVFMKYFIKSDILINNFNDLLSDHRDFKNKNEDKKSLFQKIIDSYFSQDNQISIYFIQQLKKNNLEMLKTNFLKKHAYKFIKHVNSLKEIFSEYDSFLSLSVFLNKIFNDIYYEEKQILEILKKTEFIDLLNLVSYYLNIKSMEAIKLESKILKEYPELENDSKVINIIQNSKVYPKILDMVASLIFNKKIELDNKAYKADESRLLKNIFKDEINKAEKNFYKTEKLFKHFEKVMNLNEIVTNLIYGEFTYNFSNSNTLIINPKNREDYLEFKKAGEKAIFEERMDHFCIDKFYSSNEEYKNADSLNKRTQKNIISNLKYIESLLGEDIMLDEQKIDFKEIIFIISKLAERNRRMFDEKIDESDIKNSLQRVFCENRKNGNTWNYLNYRNKEELVKASLELLKEKLGIESNSKKIISIFDFFATDINDKTNREIDLVRKPFIKIGDQYFWSYSSLAYKNLYKIISMNIFSNPQQEENYIKKKANNYEEKLCSLFKNAGYKAVSQVCKKEDIDVIAYKDGYLFMIEAKITYSRLDYSKIKLHTEGALKKAEKQLIRRRDNYLNYLDKDTMEKLCIQQISSIKKIVPLIVTNLFEGKVVRDNGIFKLSEYELDMYLSKKTPQNFIKMLEADYYWEFIKEGDLNLTPCKYKFKNLEVIHYA